MNKFLKGFVYALKGLRYAFATQINFRFHIAAAIVAMLMGIILDLNSSEWLWIVLAIAIVLIMELFNTAIEVLVDFVSPEYHPKAGLVKDLAAGAVLLTALFALIIGLIIFLPKIIIYVA